MSPNKVLYFLSYKFLLEDSYLWFLVTIMKWAFHIIFQKQYICRNDNNFLYLFYIWHFTLIYAFFSWFFFNVLCRQSYYLQAQLCALLHNRYSSCGVWEIIPEQRQIEGEREELTDKNSDACRATWAEG